MFLSFRINIEQTEMNRMVAAIISAMVKDAHFESAIKKKIGTAVDTSEMEKCIEALLGQLKQVMGTKTRLEHQMDNLDVSDPHYDKKISADNVYQLLLAFDNLYNTFCEAEQKGFMRAFIERIDIYPEMPDNNCWIRNIVFNFPMPVKGKEIKTLPLESQSTVENLIVSGKLIDKLLKSPIVPDKVYRIIKKACKGNIYRVQEELCRSGCYK